MTKTLSPVTEALLAAARAAGAESADAIAVEARSVSIDVRKGGLEQAERAEGLDIGLRVFVGQRQACISSSDTRPETLQAMASRAVAMAREAPVDPYAGLAGADQLATMRAADRLELFDPSPEPDPAALQEDARRAEAAALAVEGVTQVQSASAAYGQQAIWLAASNGFAGGYARSSRHISCVAISGEGTGMERDWCGEGRIFQADLPSPEYVGNLAAERTIARSGARRPKTGTYPVLYDERIASSLIGHLLGAINGSAISRGSSWLRDAMGTAVLPDGMSLVEDPLRTRRSGSRPFDAEGLASRVKNLVQDGVLQSWVLDLASARKLGLESTGNAVRGTSAPPSPSTSNVILTQGSNTREDLMRDMGTGLLVTSLIGSTINPNTGDYSRGASGFWVENGEIAYAVNECTIAGNLRDMLRRIIPANDAQDHLSSVVPSLLVEGMMLAGE
ncbi:TldD/PmbA family protein [Roseinatronobacter sp. HJB301]|uniref:TldD/PmbA family protein n=1 Tax=Roseinatronobacter alkalisoli TaxID=3028235 RepID=A0ABT5T4F9_9RHOB|nr:TldD/PmbA family protein [Roseinatronobacter sp. HJB301]MDD7970002.1 TldD/PmbA family protein [Roseinatronobacter sp. HJB301]